MDKPDLLRTLDDAHAAFRAALDALPDDALEVEPMPGWTRRDVVAHIEWWEGHSAGATEALLAGREPYSRDAPFDLDGQNARTLEENRGRTAADVRAGEAAAWTRLRGLLETAVESDLFAPDRFTWLGGEALADLIHSDTDDHWAEHLPHLRDA
jgi:hypothetical protein